MSGGGPSPLGMYHPGRSVVHRCRPGVKLLMLVVALAFALRYPVLAVVPTAGLYALARIPWRLAIAQIRPLWLLLTMTAAFQVVTAGPARAADVTCGLLVCVALASLVTLTTRISAMLEVITMVIGPLRRVGVAPERVALLLALTIRSVPLLIEIVTTVRQAQLARGAASNPLALAVPVVVRTLRAADALGEALRARGIDD